MQLALDADALRDDKDPKLQKIVPVVRRLLEEGFHPILFCRFIPTAEYVAEYLRKKLKNVEVIAVTGTLPPKEREDRVGQLGKAPRRVLVCTDCLSEGINLQHAFNAVIHYDLSWNPTRHKQREGRVDRFNWASPRKMDTRLTECRVIPAFVLGGGDVPQRRVQPDRVVEQLDVLEHDCFRGVAGATRREVPLAFEAGEERLHRRVVPALCHPAHAAGDAVLTKEVLVVGEVDPIVWTKNE